MNNSIERLIDGINTVLRSDVIPRLTDEYAIGQAIAIIDLLNNLKLRIDWDVAPLRAQVEAQIALAHGLRALLAAADNLPSMPDADLLVRASTGRELEQQRNRIEAWIGQMLHWLAHENPHGHAEAQALIEQYMKIQLRSELNLTARQMFAEISRGSDKSAQPQ